MGKKTDQIKTYGPHSPGVVHGDYIVEVAGKQYEDDELQDALRLVTIEVLKHAQQIAQAKLKEIRQSKGEAYEIVVNEEALVGNLPQWHHLYMEEFGAFARPAKEQAVLSGLERELKKLIEEKEGGFFLHVMSGDSGCGKSTIAKQIMRQLLERSEFPNYPVIQSALDRLRIFEVQEMVDWDRLEAAILRSLVYCDENPIYLVFLDDLFALEDSNVNKVLGILKRASSETSIYFLVTSPSWLFDKRDLQQKKKLFELTGYVETRIHGVDERDRMALKQQYETIYKGNCRPEMIAQLDSDQTEDAIILLRLSLHHNLEYSQYLDQLFERLESKAPKYLAALLLFSTLSRFYVHFPIALMESFNRDLPPADRLWENAYEYEGINELGFRLFRVRRGGRGFTTHTEVPDTVAPFHDRVAQVIYATWGEKRRNVPIFNCKLWELRNRVYQELDATSATQPVLANIFRGHLRVADDQELCSFVNNFGPVRRSQWILIDQPIASHRWINYSKYNLKRTQSIRKSWENALDRTITGSPSAEALLTAVLLNPANISQYEKQAELVSIEQLDSGYMPILIGVLEQLLRRKPLPFEALSNYLSQVDAWLDRHSDASHHFLSYRYFVIATLTLLNVNQPSMKLWPIGKLNQALRRIVRTYLLNIRSEYRSNALLGTRGLLSLVRRIRWTSEDSMQLQEALIQYLQEDDDSHTHKPVMFEHLLFFLRVSGRDNLISNRELVDTYYTICTQNADFPGLTFTSQRFWDHLRGYSKKFSGDYRQLLKEIVEDLISGRLEAFTKSKAYPDFVARLLEHLSYNHYSVTVEEIVSFLRPIVLYFGDTQQSVYVFWQARKLDIVEAHSPLNNATQDNVDKQIRLCLAECLHIPLQLVLQDFIELLLGAQITSPLVVATSLASYLHRQKRKSISPELLKEYQRQFYRWLHQNKDKEEASLYFALVCSNVLFDTSNLHGFETLAAKNIRSIPNLIHPTYFPFDYLRWWLSHSIRTTAKDQRHYLLNAFWDYSVENSHLEYKDRFVIYEDYFLLLLSRYGLKQDETWWSEATGKLINYHSHLLRKSNRRTPLRTRRTKRDHFIKLYKQRLCIEKILDTVIERFLLQRDELHGAFLKMLEEAFADHGSQPWKVRWLSKINPQMEVDGTLALLSYLDLVRGQTVSVFDLRNQLDWWYKWIASSDQDPEIELARIVQRITRQEDISVSILLLPSLLEIAKSESLWFEFGKIIQQIIKNPSAEFKDASYLVKQYLDYVSVFDLSHTTNEEANLTNIVEWCFDQAPRWSTLPEAAYGLQIAFKACFEHKLFPNLDTAEKAFFQITESQAEHEEGGAVSRYYFPWYFSNPKQVVKISKYLDWLRDNYRASQAPYIFAHILESLLDSSFNLEKHQIDDCWSLMKLFIYERLENEGSTIGAEIFWKYLVQGYSDAATEQTILSHVSREYYKICQQRIGNHRTVYLVTSFLPFWKGLVKFPSDQDMLSLWQAMLPKQRRNIEVFGRLSRDLGNHILQTGNAELISEFHETIIQFVEQIPQATLSAKFVSLLSMHQAYADRVMSTLPRLIVSQRSLEDLAYALKRFFTHLANKVDSSSFIEYEDAILAALQSNLNKDYSELCVHNVIKNVTLGVHYETISQLFRRYIMISQEPKSKEQDNFFWQVVKAYYHYEVDSGVEISIRQENMRANLLILQQNARKAQSSRYFTALLRTWSVDCIPKQAALDTLRQIVLEIHPSKWRRALVICKEFGEPFGLTSLISPDLSVEHAIQDLEANNQQGLISIKQVLARSST